MSKTKAGLIAADRLKSFIERIEKLEEERKAIAGDIKEVYSEAKGVGYDVKTLRWAVQERRLDAADRAERDALRDTYARALGMAVDLVRSGLSLREAGRLTGASKSSIHRALGVPAVSHDPETGEIESAACATAPPGGEGTAVNEAAPALAAERSCGDVGSASATHNSHHVGHAEGAVAALPASPHDTEVVCYVDGGGPCPETCRREGACVWAPAPDDLTIPDFLRRVPA